MVILLVFFASLCLPACLPARLHGCHTGPSGFCTVSVKASHDAGLDVLVGDLLVVVVGAAARRVHRRGRHGVEGEHELLSVAHARGLGMVPRNTCEEKVKKIYVLVKTNREV